MSSREKKRESEDEELVGDAGTLGHKRSRTERKDADDGHETLTTTPTKPRRGRPPGSGKNRHSLVNGNSAATDIKNLSVSRKKPSTPNKVHSTADESTSIQLVRSADSSAHRKSTRNLLDRTLSKDASEGSDEDDLLARKIWEADEEAGSSDQIDSTEDEEAQAAASTPSKKPRRRKKSPTPPSNLPPHEQYFWQNRSGRVKTSNNTLSSLSMLSHEQYHDQMSAYKDPHISSYQFLHSLHKRSFPQWRFELSESFNICLYGYGSKRKLVTDFASYLHNHLPSTPKIFIVNGYTQTLTVRTLLNKLAPLIYDCPAASLPKLPTQPRDLLFALLAQLPHIKPQESSRIYIFINSLDAVPLRRGTIPALLSHLAAHPSISLLATCDTPNFPLLWDVPTQTRYNFVFHDTTTFISYASPTAEGEASADPPEIPNVIDSVNELLGRSGRSIKGKEGVGFVLRSLPENARSLYRVLVEEILAGMDSALDDNDGDVQEDGDGDNGNRGGRDSVASAGVEYKFLYQKTVEEFICSSEMGFRQLLKEFWDHDMIVSKRESAVGGEVLGVPFRREEMEAILEELAG